MRYLRGFLLSLLIVMFAGCEFFTSVGEEISNTKDYDSGITAVGFDSTAMSVNVGESEYLKLALSPSANQGKCNVSWEFDEAYISCKTDNFGAVISGVKAGSTYIKARCNGIVATCLLSVVSNGDDVSENPYIYSNYSVVQLQPGNTVTVSASLYGGSVADMEDFVWEIKDTSVASISFSRNNCVITANRTGSTQLVCSHPSAQYDYTFVVYVYTDRLTETYITTDFNVLTINKNEASSRTVTVDLVNPLNAAYQNGFKWSYADEESKSVISLSANLNTAEIVPLKNGIAKIVVSHENSAYDLNIIVRVTTIVENVYIGLSETTLLVVGSDTPYTVYATLENYDGYVDPESFVWTVPDSALSLCDYAVSGNSLRLQGKKNGTFKINCANEKSEYSRNVLVILQNQAGSAIDSSMYITTDQNYIQTQVGKPATTVNVRLVGGIDGEDNIGDESTNFTWYIKGGESNGIVEVQEHTGFVKDLESRSAASSGDFCDAKLVINPIAAGEATIVVTHPRCLYDTEIAVKVYSESALVNPKTISTENSLIRLLNGNSVTVTATLRNQDEGDENRIEWSSANTSAVSVSPSTGQTTQISACGAGTAQTYVAAHLDGAISDKKILVLTADTEEELKSMKGIYADSTYLRISADEKKTLAVEQFGLESADRISWSSSDPYVCIVNGDASSAYCASAFVTGIAEGTATVSASVGTSEPVVFNVTVLKKGESSEIFDENAGYLTTNQNAVVIESAGSSASLSVTGVNISSSDMALYTNWTMSDVAASDGGSVFDLAGSPGSSITLTANKAGKSVIRATNKKAENSVTINAKCGELYEWNDDYIIYITSENDVVNIINGGAATIGCSLVNTTSTGKFFWNVTEGSENIEITGNTSGTCYIKGIQAGQSIITVSNSLAGEVTKEILVNVANTEEELKGYKYLTTSSNVVTVSENSNVSVSVEVKNSDTDVISGYVWRSTNSSVAEVVGSGSVAVIYGKSIGTAKVICENYDNCDYPLEMIVNVVDPVAAASDPYITCNNIVTCTVGGDSAQIAAELVGGLESDKTGFTWSIVDNSVAALYASNDSAQIKALSEGVTQVVVSHPKASCSRTILVICEPKITTACYITMTESIIKMSPSDEAKTITATLVNGEADDVYDFVWWADSYDRINMNYTGDSCVIEPLSSGTVTLHCSHPKAASVKDIVLYISNYTDFAFASSYVEVVTGTDTFVNMEVPATGVDCVVSYKSSNNSLCTVFGNSSVCTLHPGNLSSSGRAESCTITATLQTKSGAVQATAELLVSVTKKDETKPYIGLYPDSSSTIITMNKGEKRNISAKLYGNTVDTDSAGLKWSINTGSGEFVSFTTAKNYGDSVQIVANASGKTTITVSHDDENGVKINPLTLYVIVSGIDEPTVSLNYATLPIEIGEDKQTLTATVQNDTGEELEWSVVNDDNPGIEQDFFTFTTSGSRAYIYAQKPGTATVWCTIPSNGARASCRVVVSEAPSLNFFIYDDESAFTAVNGVITEDRRNKVYITSLQLYPGETKPLHWETVPPSDKIMSWYRSDNSYFDINNVSSGYLSEWTAPASGVKYHYPEGVGTIEVTGKTTEGTAVLQAKSASLQSDSVSVTNSYNYLLSLDKTILSSTPKDVHSDKTILYVNYELRPACSKIVVTNLDVSKPVGKNLRLANGKKNGNNWIVDAHTSSADSVSKGIVTGTLKFEIDGEVNANVQIKGVNDNIVSSGSAAVASEEFGAQNIKVQVYYPKHTFIPRIKKQVPYINNTNSGYSSIEKNAKYSYYDSSTNTIFLGDGEYLSGDIVVNEKSEPYSNVNIEGVSFVPSASSIKDQRGGNGKVQSDRVEGKSVGNSDNSHDFKLFHTKDYAVYKYKASPSSSWSSTDGEGSSTVSGMESMYRLMLESDRTSEVRNETVKETSYVGYLQVEYTNYAKGSGTASYKIPVYVQVRNCPCADDNSYFVKYTD